jgi:outer membrane protein TolC
VLGAVSTTAFAAPAPSPSPSPIERISFDEAIKRAVARNPTVAVAVAEIDRAYGLLREARSGGLPSLVGTGTYTRLDQPRIVNGNRIATQDQLAANLQLTVPLFAPQAWANTWHARDNLHIAEVSAADVRRQVAAAAGRAYITVVAQTRLIAAAETARDNAKTHADYAHTRLVGGVGRSVDDVRAQQDLATVESQLQAAYLGLARAREALGVLVGADGPVDAAGDAALAAPPPLAAALDDARARRADIRAQQQRVTAAQKQVDDTWVFYAPFLAAIGQPFFQEGSVFQPRTGWQAQLVLTLPFYDGGARGGVSRERQALAAESRAVLDAALRQAESEVRLAFEAILRADQALATARDAAQLAKRAYDLANLAYQAGATTNLEVVDAARRERDADVAATQAEDVARQARLDLLVASGRFP